jgi:hypothetical protein
MKDVIKFAVVWVIMFVGYVGIINSIASNEESMYSGENSIITGESGGIAVPFSTAESVAIKIIRARQNYFGFISLPCSISGINMRLWNDWFVYSVLVSLFLFLFLKIKWEFYDKRTLDKYLNT